MNPGAIEQRTEERVPAAAARFALGLFSLNIGAHVGPGPLRHQYCAQAAIPFFKWLEHDAGLRISVAITGVDVQFLADEYPCAFKTFGNLIHSGQVELISCLYAPFAWWHFPQTDLQRACNHNETILAQMGLKASRVFMAPDGHLGPVMTQLEGHFDAAVCSDMNLRAWGVRPIIAPVYAAGHLPVVVGSSGISRELTLPALGGEEGRPPGHARGNPCQSLEWRWLHFGSVEDVCTRQVHPGWDALLFDPARQDRSSRLVEATRAREFTFTHISDFVAAVKQSMPLEPLPHLVDTAANACTPSGRPSRNGNYVPLLTEAWRTRELLLACESAVESIEDPVRAETSRARLTASWRLQMLGLCYPSGETSQTSLPEAYRACREHADNALQTATALADDLAIDLQDSIGAIFAGSGQPVAAPVVCESFGAKVETEWFTTGTNNAFAGRFRLTVEDDECGVSFRSPHVLLPLPEGAAGPGLRELRFEELNRDDVILPLAESFVGIGDDTFLIRVNIYWPGPAFASRGKPWVWFVAEGFGEGWLLEWWFVVVKDEPIKRVAEIAAAINHV